MWFCRTKRRISSKFHDVPSTICRGRLAHEDWLTYPPNIFGTPTASYCCRLLLTFKIQNGEWLYFKNKTIYHVISLYCTWYMFDWIQGSSKSISLYCCDEIIELFNDSSSRRSRKVINRIVNWIIDFLIKRLKLLFYAKSKTAAK